jgi:hypothetical protein
MHGPDQSLASLSNRSIFLRMYSIEPFAVVLVLALIGFLIYLPVRFFLLVGQVKALEKTVRDLAARPPSAVSTAPVAPEVKPVAVAPAPVVAAPAELPPPLPVSRPAPAAVVPGGPDPLAERLRDLGLLPPGDLKGEYALGAWWAVRIAGVLAVAAVVFLGLWLNLRSTIPPIVRVIEVVLVGVALFWGGLRLSAKRADLGRVVAAAGLAVWQFAAWATYGLDQMRVCDSPASAAIVQFLVALGVAFVALARRSKLFAQLAVLFASVAVYFSVGTDAASAQTATGAGLVALLGVILMVRGPWGSAGVLGLIGSQVCLLLLYDAMPSKDADYLPLQLAALASFIVLWLGERLVKDDEVLSGRDARAAFQLNAFFAPALLALFLATGADQARATVSLLIAAIAALAGLAERGRNHLVYEVLLLAAVGFVAAGMAWLVDPHLVWLIWALAAAGTLLVGTRTGSELVRWSAEILGGVAAFAFVDHPPAQSWMALLGIGAFALLLAFREDWERAAGWQQLRRIVGIMSLALVVLSVQEDFPKADTGWPWLVVLLVAALRFRAALLWAALPGYLFTGVLVVFWRPLVGSAGSSAWWAVWAASLLILNAGSLWRLLGRPEAFAKVLRHALVLVTAVIVYAFVAAVTRSLLPVAREGWSLAAWQLALTWFGGAALLVGVTAVWRRLGAVPSELSLAAMGALLGFFIQGVVNAGSGLTSLGLVQSPLILVGLAGLLYVLASHTLGQGAWGTVQRSVLGVVTLYFMAFVMLARLPGAGVSLFWALASVLTFVLGHLLATRSFRMLGLIGLVIAAARVLTHDITDLLGRIVACAALAMAFFGVAWLYGRIISEKKAD